MLARMRSRPWLSMIIAIILLIIIILIFLGMKPFKLDSEFSTNPAGTYEEATARIEEIQSEEAELDQLNPVCATRLLTHSEKVENAIVFLHGFTSCPEQFTQLGQEYFDQGYNVYIPRTPRHGIKDRLGNPLQGINC